MPVLVLTCRLLHLGLRFGNTQTRKARSLDLGKLELAVFTLTGRL